MYQITDCTTDQEILNAFDVMSQLRPHLLREDFVATIRRLQATQQFHLVSLTDGDTVRAAMGMRVGESLAWGNYIYIDDLVTDQNGRSSGYGKTLLDWADAFGKEIGCKELHLDSGVQRHGAHRFYLRERMDIACYHFKKSI